jgi:hypothetical protein
VSRKRRSSRAGRETFADFGARVPSQCRYDGGLPRARFAEKPNDRGRVLRALARIVQIAPRHWGAAEQNIANSLPQAIEQQGAASPSVAKGRGQGPDDMICYHCHTLTSQETVDIECVHRRLRLPHLRREMIHPSGPRRPIP